MESNVRVDSNLTSRSSNKPGESQPSNKAGESEASNKAGESQPSNKAQSDVGNESGAQDSEKATSCVAGGEICCGSSSKHECCGVITRDREGVFHASAGRIAEELVIERATELEFVA